MELTPGIRLSPVGSCTGPVEPAPLILNRVGCAIRPKGGTGDFTGLRWVSGVSGFLPRSSRYRCASS